MVGRGVVLHGRAVLGSILTSVYPSSLLVEEQSAKKEVFILWNCISLGRRMDKTKHGSRYRAA